MEEFIYEGTVTGKDPDHFNAEEAAVRLHNAMSKLGIDGAEVINVLSEHNNLQRQRIKSEYKSRYGRDLVEDIEKALSGHFEELCLSLLMANHVFDAYSLHHGMRKSKGKEIVLTEILTSKSNQEIQEIKQAYKNDLYQVELEDDIRSQISGDYKTVLLGFCQGNRDETQSVDMKLVNQDVKDLLANGIKREDTNEETFKRLLSSLSKPHLKAVFEKYTNLQKDIQSETSGELQAAYLAIVDLVKNPLEHFARCLHECFAGAKTDDARVMQVIVSHSEVDLKDICLVYKKMYKTSLIEVIKAECRGDYEKLLSKLITSNDISLSEA